MRHWRPAALVALRLAALLLALDLLAGTSSRATPPAELAQTRAGTFGAADGASPVRSSDGLVAPDLDGRPVDVLAGREVAAVVLVFAGVDCPISNRYAPELQRLHAELAPRGVSFYFVYPEPTLDTAAARRHVADFGIPFPALLDREHRLVAHTGVEVTPEAAVLGSDGRVLYRGRIDDRWADFGQRRPQARHHDLRDALEAVLGGRPAPPPGGRAVGCYIEPLAVGAPGAGSSTRPENESADQGSSP